MPDSDDLRRRLASAGVDLPDALVEVVATVVGPMLAGLDDLVRLDLGLVEPFEPARRLADDAPG